MRRDAAEFQAPDIASTAIVGARYEVGYVGYRKLSV